MSKAKVSKAQVLRAPVNAQVSNVQVSNVQVSNRGRLPAIFIAAEPHRRLAPPCGVFLKGSERAGAKLEPLSAGRR